MLYFGWLTNVFVTSHDTVNTFSFQCLASHIRNIKVWYFGNPDKDECNSSSCTFEQFVQARSKLLFSFTLL